MSTFVKIKKREREKEEETKLKNNQPGRTVSFKTTQQVRNTENKSNH